AEAGIDGSDVSRSMLKQAVSEPTGRGADVETHAASDFDVPVSQRCLEFEASPAYEGHVFAEKADCGIECDGSTGLIDFLLIDEHAACEDQGTSALPAGNHVAFDENEIDSGFAGCCQLCRQFPSAWIFGFHEGLLPMGSHGSLHRPLPLIFW